MRRLTTLVMLIGVAVSAQAGFEPPVIIDPPFPHVGDEIRGGLFERLYPPCLTLPIQNGAGQTHLFERTGQHFDLTAISLNDLICIAVPVSPAPRVYYPLGQLPEGQYSLQVYWVDPSNALPLPPDLIPIPFGPTLQFEVRGAPVVVSGLSPWGLGIMIALMFYGIGFYHSQSLKQ